MAGMDRTQHHPDSGYHNPTDHGPGDYSRASDGRSAAIDLAWVDEAFPQTRPFVFLLNRRQAGVAISCGLRRGKDFLLYSDHHFEADNERIWEKYRELEQAAYLADHARGTVFPHRFLRAGDWLVR